MPDAVSSSQLRRPETGALAIPPQSRSRMKAVIMLLIHLLSGAHSSFQEPSTYFGVSLFAYLLCECEAAEFSALNFRKALRLVFRALISLCTGQSQSGDPVVLNTSLHTRADLRMEHLEVSQ